MANQDIQSIINESKQLLENCDNLLGEIKEMKKGVDFLINEYKTNKRWFRSQPGKTTIEDVIKACFEFGWSSKSQYDYNKMKKVND